MDSLFHFLSNLVLFLTLATLVFACGAYVAFTLRRRKPVRRRREHDVGGEAVLLRRYLPPERD
jgi:hypothetical protein